MTRLLLSACVASFALLPFASHAGQSADDATVTAIPAAKHVKKTAKIGSKTSKPAIEASAEPPADRIDSQATDALEGATADAKAKEPPHIKSGHPQIDAFVVAHAKANNVPEALVHRVIVRESKYQPDLVGHCGCIGLMQIKLGTARALGYTGDAQGLHDPNTNLMYGIKYLAGAYRAANGDHDRAVHYFAAGYYEAAKRQRLASAEPTHPLRSAMAQAPLDITPKGVAKAKHAAAAPKQARLATASASVPNR